MFGLFQKYRALEIELQKKIRLVSSRLCAACTAVCCKEVYCRESIESEFLLGLVDQQQLRYDRRQGWLGATGCRLAFGRPLVCYEFFCERFLTDRDFQSSNIQNLIKGFVAIGNRARGNQHLICIYDLEKIPAKKIERMKNKMIELSNIVSATLPIPYYD